MIDFEDGLELSVKLHKSLNITKKLDDSEELVEETIFYLELKDNLQSDMFLAEIKEELHVMRDEESQLIYAEFLAFFGFPLMKNVRLAFLQPMEYFKDWHFLIMTSEVYPKLEESKKEFNIKILSREEEDKLTELGKI